jgi:hypothetical protein
MLLESWTKMMEWLYVYCSRHMLAFFVDASC